jgi:hypothetical protein
MITMDMVPIPNPGVVSRLINNEAVLVLPTRGKIQVLNEVGARIWNLIDGSRTAGDIISLIESEYLVSSEDAKRDTMLFLSQLADREIIEFSVGV